jgi:hypothetical protein
MAAPSTLASIAAVSRPKLNRMNTSKLFRWGLIASFVVLLVSVGAMLWPLLATPRFWLAAGFAFGIVGTFFFSVALSSVDTKPQTDHEQE